MAGPSVKVAADWLDSDRLEDMGADVVLLMLTALAWSARQTTNGVVPRRQLRKLWPVSNVDDAIELLIEAEEVEAEGDDLMFVRWHEFILTAEEVDRIRELNRARDKRRRLHNRGDHSMCQPKYCRAADSLTRENHVGSRVSHGDPTRPDPTQREEGEGGTDPDGAGAPPDRAEVEARIGRPTHAWAGDCCPLPPEHHIHATGPRT